MNSLQERKTEAKLQVSSSRPTAFARPLTSRSVPHTTLAACVLDIAKPRYVLTVAAAQ